jgi:hypothetical protein
LLREAELNGQCRQEAKEEDQEAQISQDAQEDETQEQITTARRSLVRKIAQMKEGSSRNESCLLFFPVSNRARGDYFAP